MQASMTYGMTQELGGLSALSGALFHARGWCQDIAPELHPGRHSSIGPGIHLPLGVGCRLCAYRRSGAVDRTEPHAHERILLQPGIAHVHSNGRRISERTSQAAQSAVHDWTTIGSKSVLFCRKAPRGKVSERGGSAPTCVGMEKQQQNARHPACAHWPGWVRTPPCPSLPTAPNFLRHALPQGGAWRISGASVAAAGAGETVPTTPAACSAAISSSR